MEVVHPNGVSGEWLGLFIASGRDRSGRQQERPRERGRGLIKKRVRKSTKKKMKKW